MSIVVFAAFVLAGMASPKAALGCKATAALASTRRRPGVAPLPAQYLFPGAQIKRAPRPCVCCCVFAAGFTEKANPKAASDSKAAIVVLTKSPEQWAMCALAGLPAKSEAIITCACGP